MSEPKLEKACLVALEANGNETDSTRLVVQFNPETLKVTFANQIAQPQGGGNQSGTDGQQFVGAGSTKLALQLWFDVSARTPADGETIDDVRKLTQKVAQFITPQQDTRDANKFIPPQVRFAWGSFQFDGIMESLDESLEFFSGDGRPLRASVSLNITQQKIAQFVFRPTGSAAAPPGAPAAPGAQPLTAAPQGASVPQLAAAQGRGDDWKQIARANNIENPRMLPTGALLDLNVSVPRLSPSGPSAELAPVIKPSLGLRR